MSDERITTVHTRDHGPVTVPEPSWCLGLDHQDGAFRADIVHASQTHRLTVPTEDGKAPLLEYELTQRPFAVNSPRQPVVAVELADGNHAMGPHGLLRLADSLDSVAAHLRATADRLAQIRGDAE